jgi:hypothetical protein
MSLEQLIDKCDLYRYLYKHDPSGMRKDEYYQQWQYFKGLLSDYAKTNGYKVQLHFKQETTPFMPMSDWTESYEEYGN